MPTTFYEVKVTAKTDIWKLDLTKLLYEFSFMVTRIEIEISSSGK